MLKVFNFLHLLLYDSMVWREIIINPVVGCFSIQQLAVFNPAVGCFLRSPWNNCDKGYCLSFFRIG